VLKCLAFTKPPAPVSQLTKGLGQNLERTKTRQNRDNLSETSPESTPFDDLRGDYIHPPNGREGNALENGVSQDPVRADSVRLTGKIALSPTVLWH